MHFSIFFVLVLMEAYVNFKMVSLDLYSFFNVENKCHQASMNG